MSVRAQKQHRQPATTSGAEKRLVVGMGKTGLSLARWLHAAGLPFRAVDSRPAPPQMSAVCALAGADNVAAGAWHDGWFDQAETLYVSPGVPLADPAVARSIARGATVCSDIGLFMARRRKPVIAVTGSNGKSTVVSMLTEAALAGGLDARAGGNIGTPVLDLLEEPHDITVLELSSFQLEMVDHLGADVAMVLNVSPDHMDRYDDMAAYRDAKHRIFRGCGAAVVHADDAATWPPPGTSAQSVRYSLAPSDDSTVTMQKNTSGVRVLKGGRTLWEGESWRLKGSHNQLNALAVFATAGYLGWDLNAVGQVLSRFSGLPHRCEWIADPGGVTFINDSKGTNVGATLAALAGLTTECSGRLRLLLGGDGKGADFGPLILAMQDHDVRPYCFGRDGAGIQSKAVRAGVEASVHETLNDALEGAWRDAAPGDWVVLSPACASLDQFEDYQARGRAFAEGVDRIERRLTRTEGGVQ